MVVGEHEFEIELTNTSGGSCVDELRLIVAIPDRFEVPPEDLLFQAMVPPELLPVLTEEPPYLTVAEHYEFEYHLYSGDTWIRYHSPAFVWSVITDDHNGSVEIELPRIRDAVGQFKYGDREEVVVKRLDSALVAKETLVYRNLFVGAFSSKDCVVSAAFVTTYEGRWVRGFEPKFTALGGSCALREPTGHRDEERYFVWNTPGDCVFRVEVDDFVEEVELSSDQRTDFCPSGQAEGD